MDQQRLRTFLRGAVGFMEDETNRPYRASFVPGSKSSGLSYGAMQNDVANNPNAYRALFDMLEATRVENQLTDPEVEALRPLLRTKGLQESQLEAALPGVKAKIDAALAASPAAVNARDDAALDEVVTKVNTAFGAAARNPNGPGGLDPDHPDWNLVARVGGWANRVPDINDTNKFVRATPEVTPGSYGGFLKQQTEFQKMPLNRFDKWAGRIESATKIGQAGLDALPQNMPPEPANLSIATVSGTMWRGGTCSIPKRCRKICSMPKRICTRRGTRKNRNEKPLDSRPSGKNDKIRGSRRCSRFEDQSTEECVDLTQQSFKLLNVIVTKSRPAP